jgi:hypothetical protein
MIGIGLNIGNRVMGGGFDADAQAFFDRVTTAGGTLSETEKTATNTLVVQMKADGTWTPMKAIYPMVGASAAACAQNLKSSSFTGTFTSGWTFASTGVKGNGTSAYMDTNFNPSTSSNVNFKHMSYYSRDNFQNCQIGVIAGTYDQIYYELGNYYSILSSGFIASITAATTKGFIVASRTTSTSGCTTYVNNSNFGNDGAVATANPTLNLFLNGRAPIPGGSGSTNECAFASIGDGLSATQASNLYTCVQAFQTTLSRNV